MKWFNIKTQVDKFSSRDYRAEIDGLRALAVLSVVAFHVAPVRLPGGFIGVDIFFVISGFLITGHIFELLDKGQFSFSDFYSRRIRRIFPALILVMISSLAFGWFALFSDELEQLGKHVASGASFIVNFVLVNESGYFDNAAETKPMLHLWSLAVEEQFYIVWPLVLWLAWKSRINLLLVTGIAAVCSLYLNLRFVESNAVEIFFWPVGRLWELLSGSMLAWLILHKERLLSGAELWIYRVTSIKIRKEDSLNSGILLASIISSLGLLLLGYGVLYINEGSPFPSVWALIPVGGTFLVIASGSKAWPNRILLMNPIAVWIGLISYPLYLWHWPILSYLEIIVEENPSRVARVSGVLLAILLAWLTYILVERPIRYGPNKKCKTILLSLGMIGVGGLGLYVVDKHGDTPYNNGVAFKKTLEAVNDWDYPGDLVPRRHGLFSTSKKNPEVVMFGDSYVEQYGPRIVDLYRKGLIKEVGFVTRGGCAPVPNSFRRESYIAGCSEHFKNFEKVLDSNPIKTVILGGSFGKYLQESKEAFYLKDGHRIDNSDALGVKRSLDAFYGLINRLQRDYEVVVMWMQPTSTAFDPKRVLIGSSKRSIPLTVVSFKNDPFRYDDTFEKEMRLDIEALGVSFVSQAEKLCPENKCLPQTADGKPKFKDMSHMRASFVVGFMDVLDGFVLRNDSD